jgi:hypothetical protein
VGGGMIRTQGWAMGACLAYSRSWRPARMNVMESGGQNWGWRMRSNYRNTSILELIGWELLRKVMGDNYRFCCGLCPLFIHQEKLGACRTA